MVEISLHEANPGVIFMKLDGARVRPCLNVRTSVVRVSEAGGDGKRGRNARRGGDGQKRKEKVEKMVRCSKRGEERREGTEETADLVGRDGGRPERKR